MTIVLNEKHCQIDMFGVLLSLFFCLFLCVFRSTYNLREREREEKREREREEIKKYDYLGLGFCISVFYVLLFIFFLPKRLSIGFPSFGHGTS